MNNAVTLLLISIYAQKTDDLAKEDVPSSGTVSSSDGKEQKLDRLLKSAELPDSNLKPTSMLELDRNLTSSVKPRRIIKAKSAKKGKHVLLHILCGIESWSDLH